jgi:DNA-binding transcriptional LysR family regulator
MAPVLDVVPLRSLVAVAECGGFHRAAAALHLTQSAVSQHVRKLEKALARTLVVREGRQARFTPDGEALLAEARRILAAHDEALRRLGAEELLTLVVGSIEHAADQLLPDLAGALREALPMREVRFRLDRTARLANAIEQGSVDLALLIDHSGGGRNRAAGRLRLDWYAAADWEPPPADQPLPMVVYDEPCVLRRMAVSAVTAVGWHPRLVAESADLAGVLAATRSGLGVTLLPSAKARPEGLVRRFDLPEVEAAPLHVRVRRGIDEELATVAAQAVRSVLEAL